jgi:hypothetical protein
MIAFISNCLEAHITIQACLPWKYCTDWILMIDGSRLLAPGRAGLWAVPVWTKCEMIAFISNCLEAHMHVLRDILCPVFVSVPSSNTKFTIQACLPWKYCTDWILMIDGSRLLVVYCITIVNFEIMELCLPSPFPPCVLESSRSLEYLKHEIHNSSLPALEILYRLDTNDRRFSPVSAGTVLARWYIVLQL